MNAARNVKNSYCCARVPDSGCRMGSAGQIEVEHTSIPRAEKDRPGFDDFRSLAWLKALDAPGPPPLQVDSCFGLRCGPFWPRADNTILGLEASEQLFAQPPRGILKACGQANGRCSKSFETSTREVERFAERTTAGNALRLRVK